MKKLLSILLTVSVLGLVGCNDEPTKEDQANKKLMQYQMDNKKKLAEQKKNADSIRNKMWGKYKDKK